MHETRVVPQLLDHRQRVPDELRIEVHREVHEGASQLEVIQRAAVE